MSSGRRDAKVPFTLALTHSGDSIEDYLAPAGLSFAEFRDEMTGGWMFGYVEALRRQGVRTVLVVVSSSVTRTTETVHRPSGAPVVVLPSPRAYRLPRAVALAALRGRGEVGEQPDTASAPASRPASTRLGSYLATPPIALGRALRGHGCRALLCQEYEYARFDLSVALGRLLGIPVFATFQSARPGGVALERIARRAAIARSAGLNVVTEAEEERVARDYAPASPVIVRIFNPLDTDLWRPEERSEARRRLVLPQEARIAVWHGRVSMWQKGLDVLVAAWNRICRERPGSDLRLLLLGTGADGEDLRALLSATGAEGVHWRDEYLLDRALMRTYLSAADVYAFPSRFEGQPVAPLEAMACGLPVVAADASGVPDILEAGEAHGGIVVARGDPTAFAESLGRLLDDAVAARRMGALARARVESAFSLETVGAQLRTLLAGAA